MKVMNELFSYISNNEFKKIVMHLLVVSLSKYEGAIFQRKLRRENSNDRMTLK